MNKSEATEMTPSRARTLADMIGDPNGPDLHACKDLQQCAEIAAYLNTFAEVMKLVTDHNECDTGEGLVAGCGLHQDILNVLPGLKW